MLSRKIQFISNSFKGGSNWYYLCDLSMLPKKGYIPTMSEIDKGFENCLASRIWETVQSGVAIPISDIE